VVTIRTTCFDIPKLCIFPHTVSLCVPYDSHCDGSPSSINRLGFVAETWCFLWGTDWILIYYFEEIRSLKSQGNCGCLHLQHPAKLEHARRALCCSLPKNILFGIHCSTNESEGPAAMQYERREGNLSQDWWKVVFSTNLLLCCENNFRPH
jgi:hypothetical protein